MPGKKLRVGVIGVGSIAQQMHLPNWKELQDEGRIELVAVCDKLKERAEQVADTFGVASVYANYKAMLKSGDFDIVDVCTQNRLHASATIAALEAGAHVLVEKPMAMSVREAEQMIAAAKKAKRKLMTAQHMRFETKNEKLKEVIDSGALGEIYYGRTKYLRRRGIPGWGKFHVKKESLGGPLIDLGVHVMDLCVWLMGSPKPVAASGNVYRMFGDRPDLFNGTWGVPYEHKEFDVEDFATGLVRFDNGATMTVEVSWAANIPQDQLGIYILGDKAGVSDNPVGMFGYDSTSLTTQFFDALVARQPHREEIRHFTECVERNKPVRVQPEQSLNIQKIIDALYESSKRNREVRIK